MLNRRQLRWLREERQLTNTENAIKAAAVTVEIGLRELDGQLRISIVSHQGGERHTERLDSEGRFRATSERRN